jgi:hypothetical protein
MTSLTAAAYDRSHAAGNPPTGNEDGAALAAVVLNAMISHVPTTRIKVG